MTNPLKTAYRHLFRVSWDVRLREEGRKNVQMHSWPWNRLGAKTEAMLA